MDLETLKEEVRARADIVDIIGRQVPLKKASGSWVGLCPFHQEKTPSFNVNPQRQSYHCFGCGVSGDVFKFIMEMEHLDFMGALERLANQTGVEFELDHAAKGKSGMKKRLLELHERASVYFENLLREPAGKKAMAYLTKRELQEDTPKNFRLGYAPDAYEQLLTEARKWGFEEKELEDSGLFGTREEARDGGKLYDRFRNRLMFPILDEQARVIGFSGRIIPPSEVKAKYLNSPETLLFKKSRVLYGIDKARRPIAEKRRAVLCEGQLDVIRCHECGITEAVAAQGTAVTEEHARILNRYADEVILLLDADTAGIKAALRSADVLLSEGIITRVASLPPGEDPDDVVRRSGKHALVKIVEEADPFVVFQVRTLVQAEGEITETSRLRVARKVMESIAGVKEAVHREEMIRQAAAALGMREDSLRQDLQSVAPPRHPAPRPAAARRPAPPPTAPVAPPPAPGGNQLSPGERTLLEILWAQPELIAEAQAFLQPVHLETEEGKMLFRAMCGVKTHSHSGILDHLREHEAGPRLIKLDQQRTLEFSGELGSAADALMELILLIRRQAITRNRQALNQQLATASGDKLTELESEIFKLNTLENQIKRNMALKEWDKGKLLLSIIDQQ